MTGPFSGEGQRPGFEDENEDENEDALPHRVAMNGIHPPDENYQPGISRSRSRGC